MEKISYLYVYTYSFINFDRRVTRIEHWLELTSTGWISNPGAAVIYVSIFHSFEAKIADAISSFKWYKKFRYLHIEVSE